MNDFTSELQLTRSKPMSDRRVHFRSMLRHQRLVTIHVCEVISCSLHLLDYDVPALLGPDYHYRPSLPPTICQCNSVAYNLYSQFYLSAQLPLSSKHFSPHSYVYLTCTCLGACAACQNGTIGPWSTFAENCTKSWSDGQCVIAFALQQK